LSSTTRVRACAAAIEAGASPSVMVSMTAAAIAERGGPMGIFGRYCLGALVWPSLLRRARVSLFLDSLAPARVDGDGASKLRGWSWISLGRGRSGRPLRASHHALARSAASGPAGSG